MTRARLGLLLPICLASACQRDVPTTVPIAASGDSGAEAATTAGPALPIIAVAQRVISVDPSEWTFDPSGRFVAFEYGDRAGLHCKVWDIATGLVVRDYLDVDSDPCTEWPTGLLSGGSLSEESADGTLRAVMGESEVEIEIVDGRGGGPSMSGCTSCGEALVWAPTGHQLATCNGQRLEIWDGDTGKLVRSEKLGLHGEVTDLFMTWTSAGLVVVATREVTGTCAELNLSDWDCENAGGYAYYPDEDDEDDEEYEPTQITGASVSSLWWPPGGEPPERKDHYDGVDAPELYADPGGHWLIFNESEEYDRRSGESTTLQVSGIIGQSSTLGWTDDPGYAQSESESARGAWRVDAATQWLESFSIESGDEYSVYGLELGWRATVAEPNPAFHRDIVFQAKGFSVTGEIEIIGAASGAAVTVWDGCGEYEGQDDASCESGELDTSGVGDCEVLDVSPQLSLALVDCGGALSLIEARGGGASFSALPYAAGSTWVWGRGDWLALLEPGGKLGVIDLGSGRVVYERHNVIAVPEFPLAAQHDLLPIKYADHLEFVAGVSGERRIDLPGKVEGAALSPDGKQLAVIAEGQARVLEIASGATITSFAVGDAIDIAWRQDGAALFYGIGWPTHAADPQTGKLLGELTHPILNVVEPGDLDPSWRWIHRPDGSITRTLDFARIEIGSTWARLDSGMYDGDLFDLPPNIAALSFRIGEDPETVPIYTAEDLEPWLHKPNLVQAFFLGEPLPRPQIPANAAAELEAQR